MKIHIQLRMYNGSELFMKTDKKIGYFMQRKIQNYVNFRLEFLNMLQDRSFEVLRQISGTYGKYFDYTIFFIKCTNLF